MLNMQFISFQDHIRTSILLLEECQPYQTRPLTVTFSDAKYSTEDSNTLLRSRTVRKVNWVFRSCPLDLGRNSTIWCTIMPIVSSKFCIITGPWYTHWATTSHAVVKRQYGAMMQSYHLIAIAPSNHRAWWYYNDGRCDSIDSHHTITFDI